MKKGGYIVVYIATKNNRTVTGQINITSDVDYIGREECIDIINKANGGDLFEVVITNVIKLNEKQFRIWKGEQE